ncbi:8-amino-7-oxononanoate synthase [Rudaeicoccus suwonensis]|uniref:8-amino-7-oxononanoate synthase n=1 Tax=Rudaeicoccus suwonensis TaxID=657409 RepID=A0A561E987_9MICO|nr:8-amino-7-oxononanoate synthase [Rudaeicoccus suwonensis]TWE12147.1 8-amino-7-oxononanoate synthase [Rudaeicoccus suwonensis]
MSGWNAWFDERATLRHARGTERTDAILRQKHSIDLASNDYLGLASDPRVVAAGVQALRTYGASAGASRLVTGTLPVHHDLEAALCQLTGNAAALVFSSGYTANIAAVTALTGRGAHLLLDAHAHASLHDAARMCRSPYELFAHNDVAALDARLAELSGVRVLVAVESVYSVLGDAAPLIELADVCRRHGALLLVDEAHGIGVTGAGRGSVHAAGLAGGDHLLVTATLSKSLGAQGGAVLGSPQLRTHLVNAARTFIFDTGLAPAAAAAAIAAIDIVVDEPDRVAGIGLRAALIADALHIEPSAGAVQSVPISSPAAAVAARDALAAQGVLVGCFRPPSVPDGVSRLRITARADLPLGEVARAIRSVAAQTAVLL